MLRVLLMIRAPIFWIYSQVINSLYWIFHLHLWWLTSRHRELLGADISSLEYVRRLMQKFTWRADRFYDWTPWIHTIIARDLVDDCDGAGVLGRWCLEQIGIASRSVNLWRSGSKSGHNVCVSDNGRIMISNSEVVHFPDDNWKRNVYNHFDGRYDLYGFGRKLV